MQDLDLALRAVRDVEHDGVVVRIDRRMRVLGQRHQVADGRLHLLQQRACRRVVEQVDPGNAEAFLRGRRVVEGIELAHEVAALPAPGGQQRMAVRMHLFQRHRCQIARPAQGVATALHAQQLAPFDDVGPVVAARVGDGHQHLRVGRQRGQRLQRLHRHMGHAEEDHAARDRRGQRRARGERREEALVQLRAGRAALLAIEPGQHVTPQRGLPALVLGQRQVVGTTQARQHVAAGFPRGEPVAAVDLVLVVQIGQPLCELQASAQVAVTQETGQRREARARRDLGQQVHQPPGERLPVERRACRHRVAAQHLAVAAPQKARRQLDPRGSAHAAARGQRHLQPFGHAVALHQKDLFLQRLQRMAADPFEERVAQQFGAVAVQDEETGLERDGVHARRDSTQRRPAARFARRS